MMTYRKSVEQKKSWCKIFNRWEYNVNITYIIKKNGDEIGKAVLSYGYCEYYMNRVWSRGPQKNRKWFVDIAGMHQKSFPSSWGRDRALQEIKKHQI